MEATTEDKNATKANGETEASNGDNNSSSVATLMDAMVNEVQKDSDSATGTDVETDMDATDTTEHGSCSEVVESLQTVEARVLAKGLKPLTGKPVKVSSDRKHSMKEKAIYPVDEKSHLKAAQSSPNVESEAGANSETERWRSEINPLPAGGGGRRSSLISSLPGAHAVCLGESSTIDQDDNQQDSSAIDDDNNSGPAPEVSHPATLVAPNPPVGTRTRRRRGDVEEAQLVVEGEIMKDGSLQGCNDSCRRQTGSLIVVGVLLAVAILLVLGLVGALTPADDDGSVSSASTEVEVTKVSRLETIREAGVLRCAFLPLSEAYYIQDETTGKVSGFCADWVRSYGGTEGCPVYFFSLTVALLPLLSVMLLVPQSLAQTIWPKLLTLSCSTPPPTLLKT